MWAKHSGISEWIQEHVEAEKKKMYLIGNGPLLIDNISLLGAVGGGNIQKTTIRH